MSIRITTIRGTGKKDVDLDLEQFAGGKKGLMIQVTQGTGLSIGEPGFIQLSRTDAMTLSIELKRWIDSTIDLSQME